MFGIQEFGVFLVTAVVLNLTPGPDTLYIVGRSVSQGRAAGMASVLGISTGSLIHTFAAALGLSALLVASAWAFLVVKALGAAYLIFLGIRMFLVRPSSNEIPSEFSNAGFSSVFRQGLLTNLLNPKVAMFFLALVPQFISSSSPSKALAFVILGSCFVVTGTIWCSLIALLSASFSHRVRACPKTSRLLHGITGAIFVGLGVKVAAAN